MTDERVNRVAAAIWDSRESNLEWHDAKFYAKNPHNESVVLGVRQAYKQAEAAIAALGDDPPLEDVLRDAPWIAYMDVSCHEDGGYSAEVFGYVSRDGHRGGEASGPDIATAIRKAMQVAKT